MMFTEEEILLLYELEWDEGVAPPAAPSRWRALLTYLHVGLFGLATLAVGVPHGTAHLLTPRVAVPGPEETRWS